MNIIHQTAIIDSDAELGDNNRIGPFVVIGPNVRIGNNNVITSHASIGTPGQHRNYFEVNGRVEIGSNNVIREFTTINGATTGITAIGNNCIILCNSHIAHDCILEDEVTITCAQLAGECYLMRGAIIGLGANLHQRTIVGSYAMLGAGSVTTKHSQIEPGQIHAGNPARYLKPNTIGLERNSISGEMLGEEILRYLSMTGKK